MLVQDNVNAVLAIDFKKNRLRIHKTTIHLLDRPNYIQLLVHPTEMVVGIRCVDTPSAGEPVHKVVEQKDNSYEIYSRSFLLKLRELVPSTDSKCLYRLNGEVLRSQRMALFSLKTMQKQNDH